MRVSIALTMAVCAAVGSACSDKQSAVDGTRSTIACETNDECPSDQPTCDQETKVCVGCIAGMITCPAGQICSEETHLCIPKPADHPECTRDSDCPPPNEISQRSICRLSDNVCVECLSDDDCADPEPACDITGIGEAPPTYECVDGCAVCFPPTPICDRENRRCLTEDGMEILDAGVSGRDGG